MQSEEYDTGDEAVEQSPPCLNCNHRMPSERLVCAVGHCQACHESLCVPFDLHGK